MEAVIFGAQPVVRKSLWPCIVDAPLSYCSRAAECQIRVTTTHKNCCDGIPTGVVMYG